MYHIIYYVYRDGAFDEAGFLGKFYTRILSTIAAIDKSKSCDDKSL